MTLRDLWNARQKRLSADDGRKYTQKWFCDQSGLDPQRFNRIINGKERLGLTYALAIKKHLKINLDQLYECTDVKKLLKPAD